MRMMLKVTPCGEAFNKATLDGTIVRKIGRILEETKPEAAYFVEDGGNRTVFLFVDVPDSSGIPAFAEPWFLLFDAKCEFHIAMTPEDLRKADIEGLGKKWG